MIRVPCLIGCDGPSCRVEAAGFLVYRCQVPDVDPFLPSGWIEHPFVHGLRFHDKSCLDAFLKVFRSRSLPK